MDDYRPDCAENPAVKTPPPGQGLDRPAARRPDYTCTQSVIGASQTPQIDARKPAAEDVWTDIDPLRKTRRKIVGAALVLMYGELWQMNGCAPGDMTAKADVLAERLGCDPSAIRQQFAKAPETGLITPHARDKKRGIYFFRLNLPMPPSPERPPDPQLRLTWTDVPDLEAWKREHAHEMPAGEFSAENSPRPLNVPPKHAHPLNVLNGSTFNDIKRPENSPCGEISAEKSPRLDPDAARLRAIQQQLERASQGRDRDTALPVGRVIDEVMRTKPYPAQKQELAATLTRLFADPKTDADPATNPSLFTWTADMMLVHGRDPNRPDAAEIYGKILALIKKGEEIRATEASHNRPRSRWGKWFNKQVTQIAKDHRIKTRGELKAESIAKWRRGKQSEPPAE